MNDRPFPAESRAALFERPGSLLVIRPASSSAPGQATSGVNPLPEVFIAILDDGSVTAFNGHVDLGTGVRTALIQIVAEELDLAPARIAMVLGDTRWSPDQGGTAASETIQSSAVPLRRAAAQARHYLLGLAAERLDVPVDRLRIDDGTIVLDQRPNTALTFAALVAGQRLHLVLSDDVAVKAPSDYKIVGTSFGRVDLTAKASGGANVFVHDVRLPGMLHGRVVRPPYTGFDTGPFVGNSLIAVDEQSIAHIAGIVAVVVIRDFIGIVAEREENADRAARELKTQWRDWGAVPDLTDPEAAIRANPADPRLLLDRGDVDAALSSAAQRMPRSYVWPYQLHASIGPCCSVADYRDGHLTVWSGTQMPLVLRMELAGLTGLALPDIDIIRLEASGCYGRNSMDDVGGDAALLSRAVGRPVRVQLTRAQEHGWEPKGSAQVMDVDGGLDADGNVAAYDYATRYPSGFPPILPLLLTGIMKPVPTKHDSGDRTAIPPYDFANLRVVVHDMGSIARAGWLRGVSAMPSTFAHESYIDELATAAGVDPIEYRLRYLSDERAIALIEATAERAQWETRVGPRQRIVEGDIVQGQGFAYARYVHGTFPGSGSAWSAWVAEVEVNRKTGEVTVTRAVVGQDSGLMINPDGVRHQIHGNVIQSISRTLMEEVSFDDRQVTSLEWGSYPIIAFPQIPPIDLVLMPRPDQPPLGVGESASVPSAAAITNAVFDATGVRFRELPLTPERVRSALADPASGRPARKKRWWTQLLAAVGAAGVAVAAFSPWQASIAPIPRPSADVYASATIERGRIIAAVGDCAVCHTAEGGAVNAGGRPVETPFGRIYSTNITPDMATGIGAWSYPAFERAMRQGISRDGHHLYPAFPYTAFTKMADADLQALYAYLQAQAPVRFETPPAAMRMPFGFRPAMALWNAMFLSRTAFAADTGQSELWNRGAYLAEAVGHCGACHISRNLLGAERSGPGYDGAMIDGWEAPALGTATRSPLPWSEASLYDYLRTGNSASHGPALGPMKAVVDQLRTVPDSDVRAISAFIAALAPTGASGTDIDAQARAVEARSSALASVATGSGARTFAGACAVCHVPNAPTLLDAKPSLALNSNVHSDRPDNLIRTILDGVADHGAFGRGAMPGFREHFNDRQTAGLVDYIRRTYAPDRAPWGDLEKTVARVRGKENAG